MLAGLLLLYPAFSSFVDSCRPRWLIERFLSALIISSLASFRFKSYTSSAHCPTPSTCPSPLPEAVCSKPYSYHPSFSPALRPECTPGRRRGPYPRHGPRHGWPQDQRRFSYPPPTSKLAKPSGDPPRARVPFFFPAWRQDVPGWGSPPGAFWAEFDQQQSPRGAEPGAQGEGARAARAAAADGCVHCGERGVSDSINPSGGLSVHSF
jgi:hypothetical protein